MLASLSIELISKAILLLHKYANIKNLSHNFPSIFLELRNIDADLFCDFDDELGGRLKDLWLSKYPDYQSKTNPQYFYIETYDKSVLTLLTYYKNKILELGFPKNELDRLGIWTKSSTVLQTELSPFNLYWNDFKKLLNLNSSTSIK
jgi:hypothetical protein